MKKIVTWILTAVLVLGCMTQPAKADILSGTLDDSNVTWTLQNGTVTFSGSGMMTRQVYGFEPGEDYDTVVIDDGITGIDTYFFAYKPFIKEISLGNDVTTVGEWAFAETGMTEVEIPSNVKTVSNAAFYNCEQLKTVTFREGLETIGQEAFSGCKALEAVTIPASVTELGSMSFSDCKALKSVNIKARITELTGLFFSGCDSLEYFVIPDSVTDLDPSIVSVDAFSETYDENKPYLPLTDVYFGGSKTQWNSINTGGGNTMEDSMNSGFLKGVSIHYNSAGPDSGEPDTPVPSDSSYVVPDDTWNFGNETARYYPDLEECLSPLHKELIYKDLNAAAEAFIKLRLKSYTGYGLCLGFSISSVLYAADMLPAAMGAPWGYETLYECPALADAWSLITYYHLYQLSETYVEEAIAFSRLSKEEQIGKLLDASLPVVLCFIGYDEDGRQIADHAVVGYRLEEVTGEDGVFESALYDHKLALYDCEQPFDSDGTEKEWLYFNSETGSWKITGPGGAVHSSDGSFIYYMSSGYENMQTPDFTWLNDKKTRKLYLHMPFDTLVDYLEELIEKSGSGQSGEIYLPDGGKMLVLENRDADITLSGNTQALCSLTNGVFASADIPSCAMVQFKIDGGVSAEGIEGQFALELISDNPDSDITGLKASGSSSTHLSLSPSQKGFVVDGDGLSTVTLQVSDGEKETDVPVIEQSGETIEVTVENGEVRVYEDADNDGVYEELLTRTPFAAEGEFGNGVSWKYDDSAGVLTISGNGEIPDYETYRQTPWYGFRNDIKKVVINEGVTRIGKGTFCSKKSLLRAEGDERGQDSIQEIAFPSTLKEIGDGAFENCNQIKQVLLPEGIRSIGDAAFYHCYSIEELSLGKKLETLGGASFKSCTHLKKVTIPESVLQIGDGRAGIAPADGPASILLGGSLSDSGVFAGCSALETVEYLTDAGIADVMFDHCRALKTFRLSGSPESVGKYAFYASGLESFEAPESLETLGVYAFGSCAGLKEIRFYGDAPRIRGTDGQNGCETVFYGVTADACYPKGNETWSQAYRDGLDPALHPVEYKTGEYDPDPGKLTWKPFDVHPEVRVEKIIINCTKTALAAGTSLKLKTSVAPENALDKTVAWSSSNPAIAAVTADGNVTAKKVGKVTITASCGTVRASVVLSVVPAATASVSANSLAAGIRVTWKPVAGATGYKIYRNGTLVKTITDAKSLSFTDKKAKTNGKKYVYKVAAYAKTGTSTLSKSKTTYFVARPVIKSLKSPAAKKVTAGWSRNTKASGYQIQFALDKKFSKGRKTLNAGSRSVVQKSLKMTKSKTTYYVRIRTFKTVNGKKFWSAWSSVKKVKTR